MSRSARCFSAAMVGLTMLATLVITAPPGAASRAVSQAYTVPSNGVLKLTGHGYGHGHGMSQYGARGAARQNLTHRQILDFYYPGTVVSSIGRTIRVLISADTDNDVRVVPASGLRVRKMGGSPSYLLPTPANTNQWRLRTVGSSTVLDYWNGSWHTYKPDGKTFTGAYEFYRPGSVTLRVAGTTRAYRGVLRLDGQNTINALPLDDYVKGVVPREMPTSWEAAAVRAQAVAARTYAAFDRDAHSTRSYHTCDTTSCQVYGGLGAEDSRGNAAVAATQYQVLTYQGAPAFTQFGSSSGGWLSAGSRPYLVAKADKYDAVSGNPNHTWNTTVSRGAIQRAWPSLGTLKRVVVTQRDGHGDWYGRVERMTLDGSRNNVVVSGDTFRSRFGLKSSWFKFG